MKQLDIWLEAAETPIGRVARDDHGAMVFVYADGWLLNSNAHPISLSLPLTDAPFDDILTRSFFNNLLQENDQLDSVLARNGLDRKDVVGILEHIGADCAGAISCLPVGAPPVKKPGNLKTDYDLLTDENLQELVTRLAQGKSLPEELCDPSPVAGFRRKISIAAAPDGSYMTPKHGMGVPTTHILKIPDPDHRGEAEHEAFAAELALQSGINAAFCKDGKIANQDVLLIQRFDRLIGDDGSVMRLHQEDFAQAAGLPAELKYQRRGNEDRRFDAPMIGQILSACAMPARAREDFLQITLFNLLIGNNDNHAKNHALLYKAGNLPILAPFYDLVPVQMVGGFTDEFAFNIGDASKPDELTSKNLETFCREIGIPESGASKLMRKIATKTILAVEQASTNIPANMRPLDNLIGEQAEQLNELLELGLELRQRDSHVVLGGGWQLN